MTAKTKSLLILEIKMNKKICFIIVTHNRREDFNNLMQSISDNKYFFSAYNVDVIVVDNESDVLVPASPDYILYRIDSQHSNHGLAGAWNVVTSMHIDEYDYFIYSNHDVIINPSIRQFFESLTSLRGSFVLGPVTNPGGATIYQTSHIRDKADLGCCLQERMTSIPKRPNPEDRIHGFFWATNRDSLYTAKYDEDYFFNPNKPFDATEHDWQERFLIKDPAMRFLIERNCYVKHKHYSDWRQLDKELR